MEKKLKNMFLIASMIILLFLLFEQLNILAVYTSSESCTNWLSHEKLANKILPSNSTQPPFNWLINNNPHCVSKLEAYPIFSSMQPVIVDAQGNIVEYLGEPVMGCEITAEAGWCNGICYPYWQCGNFGNCINNLRRRTCYDIRNCGSNDGKPSETMSCQSLCIEGETQYCSASNSCLGTKTCINNAWGSCSTTLNLCSDGTCKENCNPQCNPDWICSAWSECFFMQEESQITFSFVPQIGFQTRRCVDFENCNDISNKPYELQNCTSVCSPNWQCDEWEACISNKKTRNCRDLNNCNIQGDLLEIEDCISSPPIEPKETILEEGCYNGDAKCLENEFYLCEGKKWISKGKMFGLCGYIEKPKEDKTRMYIIFILILLVISLYLLYRVNRKSREGIIHNI